MPIPTPGQDETKDEFIERCMSDETMKEEYPDGDQRLAVCMTQWDERQERGEKVQRPQREIRMAEIRAIEPAGDEQEMIVEGRAIVYESPTELYEINGIKYFEVIARGALEGADLRDVPFKYNHSDNVMVMARTRNKTLELIPDDEGLLVRAKLANTTAGRDLYELIRRGDVDKMSFAFTVDKDEYDRKTRTRRILRFKRIWDVSAVDMPAYDDTYISARSWVLAQVETERRAAEAARRQRRALWLKTILKGD